LLAEIDESVEKSESRCEDWLTKRRGKEKGRGAKISSSVFPIARPSVGLFPGVRHSSGPTMIDDLMLRLETYPQAAGTRPFIRRCKVRAPSGLWPGLVKLAPLVYTLILQAYKERSQQ
jgi:hypothetical protein